MSKVMYEMNSQRSSETDEETYQRAMRDPEIQQIMSDPLMRQILADSQQDPRALMDHMKNPMVSFIFQSVIVFLTVDRQVESTRQWREKGKREKKADRCLSDCTEDPEVD